MRKQHSGQQMKPPRPSVGLDEGASINMYFIGFENLNIQQMIILMVILGQLCIQHFCQALPADSLTMCSLSSAWTCFDVVLFCVTIPTFNVRLNSVYGKGFIDFYFAAWLGHRCSASA